MLDLQVLKLFNAMVASVGAIRVSTAADGYVTNFDPTPAQLKILREEFKPLPLTTLFSVEERLNYPVDMLIAKQVMHYIEVYGLGMPGLFRLEQKNGTVATVAYVAALSVDELGEKVRTLLYANAPVKDTVALKEIIDGYRIDYDLNAVQNNELRMLLYRVEKDKFKNGDDAVRYMCYVATQSPLLIKSKSVIKSVKEHAKSFSAQFLSWHTNELAAVFHRHKNLILAAKTSENKHIINRISRFAKTAHVPVHEPLAKRFVADAYPRVGSFSVVANAAKLSLRDKFKLLNYIEYKLVGHTTDAFVIRNGKVHLENNRKPLDRERLLQIQQTIVASLKDNVAHLANATILLDPNVDYGLPVSRKQTLGQLPFGTTVTVNGDTISSGIYWENAWGARDLDLSAINTSGVRTGWGQRSGYVGDGVVFSGDLTDARNGAMEFMTSKVSHNQTYALFINIFSGDDGSKFELVVGSRHSESKRTRAQWIESPVLREKAELLSKGNIVGFVKSGKFVVYTCRINQAAWSAGSKEAAIVARGTADFWTVRRLFEAVGIPYHYAKKIGVDYTHDLSYQGFSFDKLERLFDK